jgi:hypothetical protein
VASSGRLGKHRAQFLDRHVLATGALVQKHAIHANVGNVRVLLEAVVQYFHGLLVVTQRREQARLGLHDIRPELRLGARQLVEMREPGRDTGLVGLQARHALLCRQRVIAAGDTRIKPDRPLRILAPLGDHAEEIECLVRLRTGGQQLLEALVRRIQVARVEIEHP